MSGPSGPDRPPATVPPATVPPVTVRPATAADVGYLPGIEVAAGERFREVGMDDVADDAAPSVGEFTAMVGEGLVWVAVVDGIPVGYVRALDLDGQAHLEQISVRPDHQGLGLGVALVDVVVAWAEGRGADSLTLSTFRDVPFNGPWYERRGFHELPEEQWGDRFHAVRAHEAELGLDVDARIIMRRQLATS